MASPDKPITLSLPSKYAASSSSPYPHPAPALDWLLTTWTVTHSTLSMWRSARNVRITYKSLPANASSGRARLDDLVEYEPSSKEGVRKTVAGIDTQSPRGPDDARSWDWRGRGLLMPVTSHWEVLGWGEAGLEGGGTERWVVTWFASTLFTAEGLDVYCDRKEGLSEATYGSVLEALRRSEARPLVAMVEKDMKAVEIRLPWVE